MSTPDVAVITAVYGGYDPLRAPKVQDGAGVIDWVCVTDDRDLTADSWRMVVEPRPHMHPRMAAKVPRCRPDLYTNAPISIWLDASYEIHAPDFVASVLRYLAGGKWAAFHGHHSCIYAEAAHNAGMPKYREHDLVAHAEQYRRAGHPWRAGVWLTGMIARPHLSDLAALGDEWLREMVRWTPHDQISLPPLLRKYGITPVTIPGDHEVHGNPWLHWHRHERDHE